MDKNDKFFYLIVGPAVLTTFLISMYFAID